MVLVLAVLAGCTSTSPRSTGPSPSIRLSATLQVRPPTVPFGRTPKAIFRNTGRVTLHLEDHYILERSFDGDWVELSEQPGGMPACMDGLDSHFVEPGDSRAQRIQICDLYGKVDPLAPGEYRVTKTASETTTDPGRDTEEITEVAVFDVGRAERHPPDAAACEALCMSDTRVLAGQTVTVSFDPPRRYTWGAASELHEGDQRTATAIAFLIGWRERDRELTTYWPKDEGSYEDIGFRGRGEWNWEVPERLEPGIYALVKEGIREGPAPVPERRRFWTVSFEVDE